MNRETILDGLFSRLGASASFASCSRRLKLWDNVPAPDMPALFMVDRADVYSHASEAVPEMITMQVEVYLYTDAGQDQNTIPSSVLNALVDAVDTALKPDALSGRQTLSGLVSHCWIEGKVVEDAGDLDGTGVAVIPIRILVPR